MNTEQERAQFEAWYRLHHGSLDVYERDASDEYTDKQVQGAFNVWLARAALAAQPAISGYTCTVPDDCETLHWRGQILSMNELASMAQPAVGEEIMVNAAHDVLTLPLQPSGLSSGPRFVVHVSGPEQPEPDVSALVEALELARRTLAMAAIEGAVTRRIDSALAAHREQGGDA